MKAEQYFKINKYRQLSTINGDEDTLNHFSLLFVSLGSDYEALGVRGKIENF